MTNSQPKLRLAWFALAANLSLASIASAQAGEGGLPPSAAGKLATQVPTEVMPPIDVDKLLAEDAIKERDKVPGPYRFGWGHEVALGLEEAGLWEELPGGQRLWRLRVQSPGAWSINLIFDRYTLPEGARLWVHNDDGRVLGAFSSALNQPHGMFATEPIPGDAVTLEYIEPASAPIGSLRIKQVVHAYRDILGQGVKRGQGAPKSGPCNINVNCPLGANWQDQKRSSARLVVGGGLCSGALINNTAQDGKQFFLTANHCYNGAPGGWIFQFNYESATCNGSSGTPQSVSGSVLRSRSTMADHCLVEITQPIPANYNVYYSGWSRSTTPSTTSTGIHHPQGDIKKICQDSDAAVASSFSGAPCWRVVDWEQGVTEGGSSGSPLYDQNKRVIGQLFGGQATCSFLFNDYYGRFDQSWNGGGTSQSALRFHLDPGGSSPMALDGMFAGQTGPSIYCTGKVTSLGGTPQIGFSGTPSVTVNDFVIDCIGGVPNKNTVLYWGTGKATTPFMGGLLCAAAPYHREPPKLFDALGYVQYSVPVTAPMVGTTRNYQFWGRDPLHPDLTGTLLSNAVEVPFKN
jgi:lysyl endopeptidase